MISPGTSKLNILKRRLVKSPFYSIIHVSYEIMCIDKDEMPDHGARVLDCKRLINDLAVKVVWVSFSAGVYKYAMPSSLYDGIVVFKVARDTSYDNQRVIEAIAAADQQAPIFLSRKKF